MTSAAGAGRGGQVWPPARGPGPGLTSGVPQDAMGVPLGRDGGVLGHSFCGGGVDPGPKLCSPWHQPFEWKLKRPWAWGARRRTGNGLWTEMTWSRMNAALGCTSRGPLASTRRTLHDPELGGGQAAAWGWNGAATACDGGREEGPATPP